MTVGSSLTNTDPNVLRVFIIRHGQTDHNVQKILQGHLDIDMNQTGVEQARKVGQRFEVVPLDGIHTSDLIRCLNTTKQILRYHPHLQDSLRVTADLRERQMGPVEGMYISDAIAKYSMNFRNMGEKEDLLLSRVQRQWDSIASEGQRLGQKNYALCTHGGVITAFVNNLYRQGYKLSPKLTPEKLKVPFNTSVTVIDIDKTTGDGTIQLFGDTAHLGEQLEVKNQMLR